MYRFSLGRKLAGQVAGAKAIAAERVPETKPSSPMTVPVAQVSLQTESLFGSCKVNLGTAACTLASPRVAATTGDFADTSELSSLKSSVTAFAGHIAAEVARS